MPDTETLGDDQSPVNEHVKNDDFPSMGMDLLKKINFKIAIFIFVIGLFIFSDVFVKKIMPANYSVLDSPTNIGTIMQMGTLTASYICIDLLVQGGMI